MNRGIRQLAWLATVSVLAEVPLACSGFSSEETQAVSSDGGDASKTLADDATAESDSYVADAKPTVDALSDAGPFCTGDFRLCTTFEDDEDAGPWPAPFQQVYVPAPESFVRRNDDPGQAKYSTHSLHAHAAGGVGSWAQIKTRDDLPRDVRIRFDAKISSLTGGVQVLDFAISVFATIKVYVSPGGGVRLDYTAASSPVPASATSGDAIVTAGVWYSFELEIHAGADAPYAALVSPVSLQTPKGPSKIVFSAGSTLGIGAAPLANDAGVVDVYIDNVRIDAI